MIDKRFIMDNLRLVGAVLFSWLYIPHVMVYLGGGQKDTY